MTSATHTERLSENVEFAWEQMNNLYEMSELNDSIASQKHLKMRGKTTTQGRFGGNQISCTT